MILIMLTLLQSPPISATKIPPELGDFTVPPPEEKSGLKKEVMASLTVEIKISQEGELLGMSYHSSVNIPKTRIQEFVEYYKNEIEKNTITPAIEDGKTVPSVLNYTFHWFIFKPPQSELPEVSEFDFRHTLLEAMTVQEKNADNIQPFRDLIDTSIQSELSAMLLPSLSLSAQEILKCETLHVVNGEFCSVYTSKQQPLRDNLIITAIDDSVRVFRKVFHSILDENQKIQHIHAYLFFDQYQRKEFDKIVWKKTNKLGLQPWQQKIIVIDISEMFDLRLQEKTIYKTAQYLFRDFFPLNNPPHWVLTGVADYFACSKKTQSGDLMYGIINDEYSIAKTINRRYYSRGYYYLKSLKERKSELEGSLINDLINEEFQEKWNSESDDRFLYYAGSFALVNYLIGSHKTGLNNKFYTFVKNLNHLNSIEENFINCFGSLDEQEKFFWNYINEMNIKQ